MKKFSTMLLLTLSVILYSQSLKGTATYYGGKHHGRKTASGIIYDKNQFTCAASSKFKFGTLLKITNQDNGKMIIVKVTDRGGAIKGNKIDLSQAAFRSISNLKRGVINIIIERVENS